VVLGLEEVFREIAGLGKFADGHGDLVAGVATGAVSAVFEHLVAEGESLGDVEVEVFKEGWDAGEEADTLDAFGFGPAEDGLDEETSGAVAFGLRADGDGADLGEMLTVDVQGRAAEKLMSFGLDDSEGADVRADLGVGAGKEGAVVAKTLDQLMDGVGILQLRSTSAHGICFELGAGRDGARLRRSDRRGAD
jgi:hypothetical protein